MNFQLPKAANVFFAAYGDGDSEVKENGKKGIGLY